MGKKRVLSLVTVVCIAFMFLVGCGGVSVKEDLKNYDANASKVMEKMKKSDATDMAAFKKQMNEVVKGLKDLDIKTKDVKDLNKLLIKGFDKLTAAYSDLQKATTDKDEKLAKKASTEATDSQKIIGDFMKKYKDLAKKEGITIKMENLN